MFEDKIAEMNKNLTPYKAPPTPNKRVYTCEEIQNILGVSKGTVYNLIKSNSFKSVRVGGQYRISKLSFDKWLDDQYELED